MAATFTWCEDNGAATGSPSHGTTRTGFGGTGSTTDINWKSVDDCTNNGGTAYTSAQITIGQNGYVKNTYVYLSGSFNNILAGLWSAHTAGNLGGNLTLISTVTSAYVAASTATLSGTSFTAIVAIASGLTVLFSTTGPEGSSTSASISAPGYTQYLQSQLQTAAGASTGNTAVITLTVQYEEN